MPLVDLDPLPETFPGLKSHVIVDELFLSTQLKKWDQSVDGEDIDGGAIGTRVKNDLVGQLAGKIKADGHAAFGRGHSAYELRRRLGRNKPCCAMVAPEGLAVGKQVLLQPSRIKNSSVNGDEKQTNRIELEMNAAGIFLDGFILVSPREPFSGASWTSEVDDNTDDIESIAGLTKFGGLLQAHLLGFEGGTNPAATVTYEQSGDDGDTWTTLASLPAMSKPGAGFLKIPSVRQVMPLTRITVATTGTPTAVQMAIGGARAGDPEL